MKKATCLLVSFLFVVPVAYGAEVNPSDDYTYELSSSDELSGSESYCSDSETHLFTTKFCGNKGSAHRFSFTEYGVVTEHAEILEDGTEIPSCLPENGISKWTEPLDFEMTIGGARIVEGAGRVNDVKVDYFENNRSVVRISYLPSVAWANEKMTRYQHRLLKAIRVFSKTCNEKRTKFFLPELALGFYGLDDTAWPKIKEDTQRRFTALFYSIPSESRKYLVKKYNIHL